MQSVSSRIWTHVAVSTSCDDNHYTTDTSTHTFIHTHTHTHTHTYIYIYIYSIYWKWFQLCLTKVWIAIYQSYGNLISLIKQNDLLSNLWLYQYYCMDAPHGCKQYAWRKSNYTRLLCAVFNKSWKQYPTK